MTVQIQQEDAGKRQVFKVQRKEIFKKSLHVLMYPHPTYEVKSQKNEHNKDMCNFKKQVNLALLSFTIYLFVIF